MVESKRLTREDKVFYSINNLFLGLLLVLIAYPMLYIISSSFSSTQAVITGKVWLFPVDFSLDGYKAVFENEYILKGYLNSFYYALAGTAINIVMTILAAYPLSRKNLWGKGPIMFLFTFTMLFSGGIIPNYLLVKNLGMINTRWALLIPNAIMVYNMIIARTFFQNTIPDDLLEASRIDGCSDFRFLVQVVLPLSQAIIAVLVLYYAVFHWNSFFQAFIYLSNRELFPLQIVLRDILIMNSIDADMIVDEELLIAKQGLEDLLKYSLIIVASLPIWCVYPFAQKYFIKGVMIGSIKG